MAAGATYTPIATTTVSGSSTNQVTFSSIASTYTDIYFAISANLVSSANDLIMFYNNESTGTNYSATYVSGNGTSATSTRYSSRANIPLTYNVGVGNGWGTFTGSIQNYANTTTYKTVIARSSNAYYGSEATVGLWRSTAAINRVDFIAGGSLYFAAGSTFTLYGIVAA